MKLTLTLRYTEGVHRPTEAWLIPGDDLRAWLEELCRWEVSQAKLKLCRLTLGNRQGEQTLGLLAITGERPKTISPLCRPYGTIARRLYLPVEAQLNPIATDGEISKLLASPDGDYVWHPTAGLVGFAADEVLRVSDLLEPLALRAVDWDRAQPGIRLNDRLLSIEPDTSVSLADIMREAGGDIGRSASEIGELPRHPSERGPTGKIASALVGGLANAVNWAMKQVQSDNKPPQPSAPKFSAGHGLTRPQQPSAFSSLMQKLQHWATRANQQISQSIEVERHRQLARLLQMLEKDPDVGLKYALPLTGNGAPRGLAPPSASLAPRETNFNLGRLGGGGAVDAWDAGAYQMKLMHRYRELANRELALGRHRRAAYIYSELLGDLASAATALESGGHYREAAALFSERLNQPLQAAHCLAKGQLWSEAIAIYERLGYFETVGDLYLQIDDREQAKAAYEQAFDQLLQRNDHLAAARLLEHKMQSVDRAYRCLLDAWPASPQGVNCLAEAFRVLDRHRLHDEADRLVREFSDRNLDEVTALQWIERLSHVASDFTHQPVRQLAADRTRILVAQRLEDAPAEQISLLTAAVARLAPGDRLLARDATRFLQNRRTARPRTSPLKPNSLAFFRDYHLPMAQWRVAIAVRKTFYAAGWRGRELLVLRGSGEDVVQTLAESWTCENADRETEIVLAAHPGAVFKLIAHPVGLAPLAGDKWFAVMGQSFDDRMSVGPHPGLTAQTIGVHYGDAGRVTCFDATASDHILMRSYAGGYSELAGTFDIDLRFLLGEPVTPPFITQLSGSTAFVGAGQYLIIVDQDRVEVDELPAEIRSLVSSGPYSRPRLAIGFEQGASLYWGYRTSARRERFAHDLTSPVLAFTDGGYLIAAAEQGIEVYATPGNHLSLVARQQAPLAAPLAVFSGSAPNQFRVLFRDGRVRVYKIAA